MQTMISGEAWENEECVLSEINLFGIIIFKSEINNSLN